MKLRCPMRCAYLEGNAMDWPPRLLGTSNWSTGDIPTLLAYVWALGDRLAFLEEQVHRLESRTVGSLKG